MEKYYKQFAEWGTALRPNVFLWARLKLTATYVVILAVILAGFSLFLYQNIARNLVDAGEEDFAGVESHHHFVEDTLSHVQDELLLIDLIILLGAAGVSYALAGYTLRPIKSSMEAQQKFSENAAHELRTPLAVMKNDAEVLLRNANPTKELIHKTLRSNIEEIERLTGMATDLLTLARSEKTTLEEERIDIHDLAVKITDKLSNARPQKDVAISALGDSAHVLGNAQELERILTNIIQNALQHTSSGGSVTVETTGHGSAAIIKVIDTGTGIDAKDLPHIFERFYKGEKSIGTGLGLSIVKDLIVRHGGTISIESELGKGTTVTIRLPSVT